MSAVIAVIDYGMGNLHSVAKALEHVAPLARVRVTQRATDILEADRVVFPGQGAIGHCMQELARLDLVETVRRAAREKPFLGMCLGPQALMTHSDENGGIAALDVAPCDGLAGQCFDLVINATSAGLHGESLPLPDASADFLSMGYALRHIDDVQVAFAEFRRVLRPGGRVVVLEITRPAGALGRMALRLGHLVLEVGRLVDVVEVVGAGHAGHGGDEQRGGDDDASAIGREGGGLDGVVMAVES